MTELGSEEWAITAKEARFVTSRANVDTAARDRVLRKAFKAVRKAASKGLKRAYIQNWFTFPNKAEVNIITSLGFDCFVCSTGGMFLEW